MKKTGIIVFTVLSLISFGACSPQKQTPQPEQQLAFEIKVDNPQPNTKVTFPLTITGTAQGFWYFEGAFSVKLLDMSGQQLAQARATAQGDWMTEDLVPFEATIENPQLTTIVGSLLFENDNPSGLPENTKSFEVPVYFK